MLKFWKNAGIMAFAEIFLKLKALFMMPFITKYLGAVNYGIWSQVMVIVSLLSPLIFCGMENSLGRFLPGRPIEQQRKEFTGWFIFGVCSSICLFVCIFIISNPLSELFFGTTKEFSPFIVLAGLNIVVTCLLTGIRSWFRVQNDAWSLVIITVMQNLLQMGVVIGVLLSQKGIYELVSWSLVSDCLLMAGYLIYMLRNNIFASPSLGWLKPYFKFGIIFLPSGYAVWVLNSLDRVFLAQYHSLADIGIYSIGFTIGYTLIQVIVNPIWNLFPTKSAEFYNLGEFQEINLLLNQSIKLICWIIFPSIFGFILIGRQLLGILSTDEFASGYLVIPIILSGYCSSILSSYFETILTLKNKPHFSTIFTLLSCSINIILNFLLIPKFSYIGAAVATTISFMFQLGISIFYASKENLIELDKKSLAKILLASTTMFCGTYIVKSCWLNSGGLWAFLLPIFLGIFLYSSLTYLLKIYDFKYLIKNLRGESSV